MPYLSYQTRSMQVNMPCVLATEMDDGSQPCLRDQLFESAAVVLDIIKSLEPSGLVDLGTLEEGLRSLQDTLLGSTFFSSRDLDPFYLLCRQVCDALTKQASPNGYASQIADISVMGYGLYQLREVLLALSHALSTYLNIIRWYVKIVNHRSNNLRY